MRLSTVPAVLSAAALLLLAGCGGGDDDSSTAAGSSSAPSSSSSPAETSAAPDGDADAFCSGATDALSSIQSAIAATATDPTQASAAFSQAAATLDAVTAPSDIEADWQVLIDSFQQVADETAGLDISTPEGQTQFESVIDGLSSEADPASASVETYLTDNCGSFEPSAAPTS